MRRQPWARTFTLLVRIVNQTIASHRLSPLLNLITVPRPRPPALALATANTDVKLECTHRLGHAFIKVGHAFQKVGHFKKIVRRFLLLSRANFQNSGLNIFISGHLYYMKPTYD